MGRARAGCGFSGNTADYWAPTNWASLDSSDEDIGACGPLLVNVPAFRRRDERERSRSFVLENQSLRHSPKLQPARAEIVSS
jgi:hypothetical protein